MLPFKITSDYGYIGRIGWINSVCDLSVKIHIGGNYEHEWIGQGLFTATFQIFGDFFIIPRMFSNPEEALQLKLEVIHDECKRLAAKSLVMSMFRSLGDHIPMESAVSQVGEELGAEL